MQMIKARKLFQRTLFGVFALFGFIGISTSFLLIDTVNSYLSEEYENNSLGIAQTIADASVDILLNRDLSSLQSLIDQFVEIQGINYVYIRDETGEFLAHTFVPGIPEVILNSDPSDTSTVERQLPGMGDFVEVSRPILAGVAGAVHVGMDTGIIALLKRSRVQTVERQRGLTGFPDDRHVRASRTSDDHSGVLCDAASLPGHRVCMEFLSDDARPATRLNIHRDRSGVQPGHLLPRRSGRLGRGRLQRPPQRPGHSRRTTPV